jgi:CMP-N-acetylneuraminic acid synthetase
VSLSIVIPAQEINRYHKLGDLAPFGDTTLLEWKISQCKEFVGASQIFINSDSEAIQAISQKEGVHFIKRPKNIEYQEMIYSTFSSIRSSDIMWVNVTSPFMGFNIYSKMYQKFQKEGLSSLIPVERKEEYVFYKNQKLNFHDDFVSRKDVEPIYIMTNSCGILKKDIAIKNKNTFLSNPNFFEVDSFSATEIKDMKDYLIAIDMISIYFRNELYV